jgi:hypothetical protein
MVIVIEKEIHKYLYRVWDSKLRLQEERFRSYGDRALYNRNFYGNRKSQVSPHFVHDVYWS